MNSDCFKLHLTSSHRQFHIPIGKCVININMTLYIDTITSSKQYLFWNQVSIAIINYLAAKKQYLWRIRMVTYINNIYVLDSTLSYPCLPTRNVVVQSWNHYIYKQLVFVYHFSMNMCYYKYHTCRLLHYQDIRGVYIMDNNSI